jgi:hypothetical protein
MTGGSTRGTTNELAILRDVPFVDLRTPFDRDDAPRPPDIVPNQPTDKHKRRQTQTNANKNRYFDFHANLGDKNLTRTWEIKISREPEK